MAAIIWLVAWLYELFICSLHTQERKDATVPSAGCRPLAPIASFRCYAEFGPLSDPLQKWVRGERYPSNMNVINISAKRSELDLGR
ncbi:hypothetical protein V1283_001269 [Bradyrhizobium sp. AZCC 2262]